MMISLFDGMMVDENVREQGGSDSVAGDRTEWKEESLLRHVKRTRGSRQVTLC